LSIVGNDEKEINVTTSNNQTIEVRIPRDPAIVIPTMSYENVTGVNNTAHHLLFNLHYVNITSRLPISIHLEMQSLNDSLAYLFIYRFDESPIWNSSVRLIDGWSLFCPQCNVTFALVDH
jgi:hypothetical protein